MFLSRLLALILLSLFCVSHVAMAGNLLDASVAPQHLQTDMSNKPLPVPKQAPVAIISARGQSQSSQQQADSSASQDTLNSDNGPSIAPPAEKPSSGPEDLKVASSITLTPQAVQSMQSIREIEGQLSSLDGQMSQYQKQNDARLSTMQGQIIVLQNQLTSLKNAMLILSQNVPPKHVADDASSTQTSMWGAMVSHIEGHLLLYMLGFVLLLLLVLYFVFGSNRPTHVVSKASSHSSQEYDFLGSPEGVAAKLDLARAYFAMQDFTQMKVILEEIVQIGDEEQKRLAQEMLNTIPAES